MTNRKRLEKLYQNASSSVLENALHFARKREQRVWGSGSEHEEARTEVKFLEALCSFNSIWRTVLTMDLDAFKRGYLDGYVDGCSEPDEDYTNAQAKAYSDGYEKGVADFCRQSNI